MAAGKKEEEKKEDKGKEKEEKKKKEGSDDDDVINAIYKVNLHCPQCVRKIKKHLLVTQGVHNVETDMEKGEIKVKGKLEPLKILKLIEKNSNNKKVELISPKIKIEPPKEKPKEIKKQPIIRTIKAKVHMHCGKCERDLKTRLIKHRGIFSVKTDKEAETVTIEGSIEPERFLRFLKRKVHKNAEIISSKEEKKVEDKEKEKGKQEEKGKAGESTKEKEKKKDNEAEEKEKKKKESDGLEETTKIQEREKKKKESDGLEESTQIIQIEKDTKVEIVAKQNVPYIIHYVYAPQLFSDENPNACSIS